MKGLGQFRPEHYKQTPQLMVYSGVMTDALRDRWSQEPWIIKATLAARTTPWISLTRMLMCKEKTFFFFCFMYVCDGGGRGELTGIHKKQGLK